MNNKGNDKQKPLARIKDIAEKAGVSAGTVDRVIHDRGRVSKKARERVLQIIKELNYEPNVLARALVSRHNYRLGALIPDPSYDEYWEAPEKGVSMAQDQLKQYGIVVQKHLFNQNDAESFKRAAEDLSKEKYNGIVAAPLFYREALGFMKRWKNDAIPFTLFNTHIPDFEPLSYIGQNSYQSGVLAGKLLHYGSKSSGVFLIAHIDEDVGNSTHLLRKEKGFLDYFEQNGNDQFQCIRVELERCGDEVVFFRQMDLLFTKYSNIIGFFVTNSRAYSIANYLKTKQYRNVLLVGYDLLTKNLNWLNEGIIHFLINQNPKGQGFWGVRLLADYLLFKKPVEAVKYLPLDVITRENVQYYI
jgi:LacI family transcriptional regulator